MNYQDALEKLAAELVAMGHDARPVPGSPVWGLNVWKDGEGRIPTHTVWIDSDGFTWGHSFEYNQPPTERAWRTVAEAIAATL